MLGEPAGSKPELVLRGASLFNQQRDLPPWLGEGGVTEALAEIFGYSGTFLDPLYREHGKHIACSRHVPVRVRPIISFHHHKSPRLEVVIIDKGLV